MQVLDIGTYHLSIGAIGQTHWQWLRQQNYAGIAVLADGNTVEHCAPLLRQELDVLGAQWIIVPAGEQHKNMDTAQYIWQQLFAMGAGRRWCLINLGGGVIGDMGGFCAATFKRGMYFVQVPTTLLSQVDASVGGKLGIDFQGYKNSIGVFQDPAAVWADARFFQTLSARELRSGFAEILKHALIADVAQWHELQNSSNLENLDWTHWVARSVAIKQHIVKEDPFEQGLRKALNFGHTIGHAVESYFLDSDAPLLHGEAIALGMVCEAWLSTQLAGLPEAQLQNIVQTIMALYPHVVVPPAAHQQLLATMRQDKKNDDHRINFSLLSAVGQVQVNHTAATEMILESLAYYHSLS